MALHKDLTGTDLHAPGAHKTQHEDGGSDEISLTGLTGSPVLGSATTATTQSPGDNSTKVATTAYVDAAVGAVSGTLDGLSDVTITTPADGDVLTYDSGSGDWINGAGGSGSVPLWVSDHPDSQTHTRDFLNASAIGGTTLGSPGTAPAIANNRLVLTGNTPGVSASVVAVVWSAPGSTPYTITASIRLKNIPATFRVSQLLLRSSVSGKFITSDLLVGGSNVSDFNIASSRYDSLTSRASQSTNISWYRNAAYFRITNDGTNIVVEVSDDGTSDNWYTIRSETLATHFGANLPDQYGVGIDSFSGTTAGVCFVDWIDES